MDFKGRNAIVTGGASGIGLAIVKELLKNGVGKCAILDINSTRGEEIVKKLVVEYTKDRVFFVKCDVTKMAEFETALKTVMSVCKTIDIIINAAEVMNETVWDKEILTNFNGVVNGTTLGLKMMGKDKGLNGGIIVNVSSVLGLTSMAGCPVYVATKQAVISLTKCYSLPYHFNRTGVRMMVLCPGVIDVTDTTRRTPEDHMAVELNRELTTMQRQQPEHIATGLVQLLSQGENGSIWVCEAGQQLYEVTIPTRMEMRRKC